MQIDEAKGVLLQPMLDGIELFLGARYEPLFGHVVLCGLGGILVEVLHDVAAGLAPLTMKESHHMIGSLKGSQILDGVRGQEGISKEAFAGMMVRLSSMLEFTREIAEMDLNPILGKGSRVVAVDARIRIQKKVL
jgi:acetyltransferase